MGLTSRPIELRTSKIYFLMMRLKISVMMTFLLQFSSAGSWEKKKKNPIHANKQTNEKLSKQNSMQWKEE